MFPVLLCLGASFEACGQSQPDSVSLVKSPRYSVAGLSVAGENETSVRKSYGMNPGWKFFKGDVSGAEGVKFDDDAWESVNLPHGLEILPAEASGGANYQGPAWYRKTFSLPDELKDKKIRLYFEAIMGKSSIWVNGKLLKEYKCGYLPIIVDISDAVKWGEPNIIAVRADNSDDSSFPPGKPQETLDFSYFGGIYRDAYLLGTGKVYITDPNEADTVGGGGVFFRTQEVTAEGGEARAAVKVQVANETSEEQKLSILATLSYPGDLEPAAASLPLVLAPGARGEVDLPLLLKKTRLWSPENPRLYNLAINVYQNAEKGASTKLLDSCSIKVGVRTFSLSDKGLILNGKPYQFKLLGANRHQDYATLGNAVPNNLQWMDAVKLRDAGMKIVRSAHYPQDPAFMDACDRLGMFVIVATPGWQFWGKGDFGDRVAANVRQMVRRDRNHPCVLMWEPILNETYYPVEFAKKVYDATHEEFPYPGCYAAADNSAQGAEFYDLTFMRPEVSKDNNSVDRFKKDGKARFTREYGDYVDCWLSHNSKSRVSRKWGETAMLVQALHYLNPPYNNVSVDMLEGVGPYHLGGCLWHPFDHQRGYHPDPFYGGIFDAYRQPKTSFYAYKSQRPPSGEGAAIPGTGPFIHIANECTPFSPEDVTVYTNCDMVRLSVNGGTPVEKKPDMKGVNLKHPPIVFEKAWNFSTSKGLSRANKIDQIKMVAEGIIDGKVVARHEVRPARRPGEIRLALDAPDMTPEANGSDIVQIIASVTDSAGSVKRLNNEQIRFEVEGPAEIIGDEKTGANPREVEWGTAPVLLRMGTTPGKITVRASVLHPGKTKPVSGKLEFTSSPASHTLLGDLGGEQDSARKEPSSDMDTSGDGSVTSPESKIKSLMKENKRLEAELREIRLREVGRQQTNFE